MKNNVKTKEMVELYYFSPTGGTRRVGVCFCAGLAEQVKETNLAGELMQPTGDLVVVAAPVYGGRIPALVTDKLRMLTGAGKKAVTLAVYGNRAYEDALLELNRTMQESGFEILASAALLAQHSIVPAVGAGRPDEQDVAEINAFAEKVLVKLAKADASSVEVPGNYPYKESKGAAASPITREGCSGCGRCVEICPAAAMRMENGQIETDAAKCILCMACVANCPAKARKLPDAMQEAMTEKLSAFASVRRENEFFL